MKITIKIENVVLDPNHPLLDSLAKQHASVIEFLGKPFLSHGENVTGECETNIIGTTLTSTCTLKKK